MSNLSTHKFGFLDFSRTANSVLNKGRFAIPPLFNDSEVLSSGSDKAKLFAENISISNPDDSCIPLLAFPSRANPKLHNTPVTPKLAETVISNLHLSKVSGPDCVPVVVLKNCESELSFILPELFNLCLRESCFKVSSFVLVFKNMREKSTPKNYHSVSLLSVVSNISEKLVNNKFNDHLEKCGLITDF